MKLFKLPMILCIIVLLSILSACGADDIIHGKSDHWDVSLQRSTGSYSITYIGDETHIKDFVFDLTGNNIDQQGKALEEQEVPFSMSGTATEAENTKDPITFKMSWNNQSEIVTFE
ncbi:hypothetical protein J7E78_22990 [Paenibacillus polymyxa]|uniref:hypothetical protein n=1 Tax=Paenibacillus polymyxa TaxID=1406 RepID=UPI001BE600DC|nr:hypothetical protein [Paenibacillus polymyxa]MBT2286394.1 hypothetical protein [Paenibacillus polymyxa]